MWQTTSLDFRNHYEMKNSFSPLLLAAFFGSAPITSSLPGQGPSTAQPPGRVSSSDEVQPPAPGQTLQEFPYPKEAPTHAKDYLRMHTAAAEFQSPEWEKSLRTLVEKGDWGSVLFLKELKTFRMEALKLAAVERAITDLEKKSSVDNAQVPVSTLVQRLERAALADVTCHRLERTMVEWAMKTARAQIGRPEVRKALETLVSEGKTDTKAAGFGVLYKSRLAEDARALLKP